MMKVFYLVQVFNDLDQELRISSTDELEVGQCLGEGNFGKVYQGLLHRRVCFELYLITCGKIYQGLLHRKVCFEL